VGSGLTLWLADACALIDLDTGDPDCPPELRASLEASTPDVAVRATTVWEIAIKTRRGRLPEIRASSCGTLTAMLEDQGYALLPFDRALVAAAQRTGRVILTSDTAIAAYGVSVRWQRAG